MRARSGAQLARRSGWTVRRRDGEARAAAPCARSCLGAKQLPSITRRTNMPIGATFHDWSEATLTSLGSALALLLAAIPKIIGFALILLIGWFIASLIQRAVAGLARAVHFNNLARRSGFADFVQRLGIDTDASGF